MQKSRSSIVIEQKYQLLQQDLKFYKNIIFSLPVYVYLKDINGVYLDCNLIQALDVGLPSPEEVLGKTDYDILPKDHADLLRKIDSEIIKTGLPIKGEATVIIHVLFNLLKNSIYFIQKVAKGEILISTRVSDKGSYLHVKDNSQGIDPTVLPNIFNQYLSSILFISGVPSAILDPAYLKLFNQVKQDCSSCEYYILEGSGSMLFLDAQLQQPTWLLVKTEEDMVMIEELAFDEPEFCHGWIKQLHNREKIVHLSSEFCKISSSKYGILQDANLLRGNNDYYYSVVKGTDDYNLQMERIMSYQKFLCSTN